MNNKVIYRLNDDISFRKCDLHDRPMISHGDCTNYDTKEQNWTTHYYCNQDGIHLHCTQDPEIELDFDNQYDELVLVCPKCKKRIDVSNLKSIYSQCQKMLNMEIFKDAQLVRLDDWYIHEVKDKIKPNPDYFITSNVKTDKDGNTIVVLYVGYQGSKEKVQFFIKPERGQLSSDHKDLDPAKILSRIEVTLKNRTLTQDYEDE